MKAQARSFEDRLRAGAPVSAPAEQLAKVVELQQRLEAVEVASGMARGCQLVGPEGERIELPEAVFRVLVHVAEVMARGDAITLVPVGRELTTQQAAELLNVSRQYLVRLLEEGKLPFRKTGSHRRLRIEDVLAYRDRRDRQRRAGLQELTRLTEEAGGYDRGQ